jgi:hypothetical protein
MTKGKKTIKGIGIDSKQLAQWGWSSQESFAGAVGFKAIRT